MSNNPLEDFIEKLSPEERQKHQALIRECLDRREFINRNSEKTMNSIDNLNNSIERLRQGVKHLEECTKLQCDLSRNLFADIVPLIQKLSPGRQSMN